MSTHTHYSRLERTRTFRDVEDVESDSKEEDASVQVVLDLEDALNGDTISSAAYEDSGVTTSGKSTTSTTVTFTVTGIGETEITLTLASGRTMVIRRRWYDIRKGANRAYRDYR